MKEVPRRLWHIGGGLSLPIAGLLAPQNIFLPALCSVTTALLIFEGIRLKFPHVNRRFATCFRALLREREASTLTSSAWLLIAACIVFIFYPKPIATIALTFVAVGDPIAGIVGERWGQRTQKRSLSTGQKPDSLGGFSLELLSKVSNFVLVIANGKSLEGSAACLAACLVAGAILTAITHVALWVVVLGAICATLVELLSLPPNDNLAIPLVTGGIMSLVKLL